MGLYLGFKGSGFVAMVVSEWTSGWSSVGSDEWDKWYDEDMEVDGIITIAWRRDDISVGDNIGYNC